MGKRHSKGAGLALLMFSVIIFVIYAYFLFATEWGIMILKFTVLGAAATLLAVFAWIGYTMATAPKLERQ
jgi:predicted DNA-binding transcriptional regulator